MNNDNYQSKNGNLENKKIDITLNKCVKTIINMVSTRLEMT